MLIFVSGILLLRNVKKREDESSCFEKQIFSRYAISKMGREKIEDYKRIRGKTDIYFIRG